MIDLNKPLVQNYSFPVIREKTGFVTNIKNIYEDKEGDLWIDQNRWGIGIYNPDSNKLLFYTDIPSLKNIANLKNVSCITSVPLLNEIWLGSEYYPEIYKVKKDKKGVELLGTLKLTDYVDNFILIVIIIFGWEQLKVFWLNRQRKRYFKTLNFHL